MGYKLSSVLFAALILAGPSRADLLRVSSSGSVEFTHIQTAILAAAEGDVIVVGNGTYPGFVIDGKGVSVVAMQGHQALIEGPVRVRNVPAGSTVLLSGLQMAATYALPTDASPPPVLELATNAGSIRVQGCLIGHVVVPPSCSRIWGVTAAHLIDSPDVSFVDCELAGSDGTTNHWSLYFCDGMPGGHGLLMEQGSRAALENTLVNGGRGGDGGVFGGDGGSGARVLDSWLFARNSVFQGGRGGTAQDTFAYQDGHGGHGVFSSALSHLVHVDCSFAGSMAGWGVGNGLPGQPLAGPGTTEALPGPIPVLLAPRMAVAGATASLVMGNVVGDEVRVARRPRSDFRYWPLAGGVWLLPFPSPLALIPDAIVPPQGTAFLDLALPSVTSRAALLHLQTHHTPLAGPPRVSPGRVVVLIDPTPVPGQDCNGNGVLDLVDLLLGNGQDFDGNLLLDSCLGPGPWYVDAGAAPGGNGSAAAPYQTLAEAFQVAADGSTILVLPGLYTGAANRDLDLTGRALTVRGLGPAGSVVIDAEHAERLLLSTMQVQGTVRLENLTVRRARAAQFSLPAGQGGALMLDPAPARLQLVGCRFEECSATGQGGALRMVGGSLEITDTVFDACTASLGGAISISNAQVEIRRSLFHRNLAADGAAILGTGLTRSWFHGVRWLDNAASTGSVLRLSDGSQGVLLQDCVVAGNSAAQATVRIHNGACGPHDVRLSGLTVFGNGGPAGTRAILLEGRLSAHLRNSILWGHANGGLGAVRLATAAGCAQGPLLTVAYSNLESGLSAFEAPLGWIDPGSQILDLHPAFENPNGADGNPATWLDNDLSLSLASPSIDAGSTTALLPDVLDLDGDLDASEPVPHDSLGNPRVVDVPSVPDTGEGGPPTVDMGAFERQR